MARRAPAVLAGAAAAWIGWCLLVAAMPESGRTVGTAVIALVTLPLGCLVVVAAVLAVGERMPAALLAGTAGAALAAVGHATDLAAVDGLGKLLVGVALGLVAGRALEAPWNVLLVAVLVIGVDAYSVFAGPTKAIAEDSPDLLSALTVPLAGPGRSHGALLGITDILFLALFCVAALRWHLRPALTIPLCALSFSLIVPLSTALDRGLPALPLLSIAFILPNARRLLPGASGARGPG